MFGLGGSKSSQWAKSQRLCRKQISIHRSVLLCIEAPDALLRYNARWCRHRDSARSSLPSPPPTTLSWRLASSGSRTSAWPSWSSAGPSLDTLPLHGSLDRQREKTCTQQKRQIKRKWEIKSQVRLTQKSNKSDMIVAVRMKAKSLQCLRIHNEPGSRRQLHQFRVLEKATTPNLSNDLRP